MAEPTVRAPFDLVRTCQTRVMSGDYSEPYDEPSVLVGHLTAELIHCRQRGLEWLEQGGGKQYPVPTPDLHRLAQRYLAATNTVAHSRVEQIKTLLRQAIADMQRQGHDPDARLLRDLYFGDATNTIQQKAGELLTRAKLNSGEISEVRFREHRARTLRAFASFLIQFVDDIERGNGADGEDENDRAAYEPALDLHGGVDGCRPVSVSAGYVGDQADRFVQLLAAARNVTIIGFTHEQLARSLAQALELKQARSESFWSSLRIVFLSDALLDYVNDERVISPNRREAVKERRRAMTWGRRSVRLLLRRSGSTRWELFESPFLPPFAGTLFQLPDGPHMVQVIIRRPQWSTNDQMFFEFEDLADEYVTGAFEDAVRNSISDNRPVPIGAPSRRGSEDTERFLCREQRKRLDILRDGSNERSWLPLVLVITTQRTSDQIHPVLQLRTEDIAVRELDRISHLSGHIYQHDYSLSSGGRAEPAPPDLGIDTDFVIRTAQRRVQEETGDDVPPPLLAVATGRYVNPDKENLFFFVYRLDLGDGDDFPARSEMHRFPLNELLAIRRNHTLRMVRKLCDRIDLSPRTWASAAEILSLNLMLGRDYDLAERLPDLAGRPQAAVRALADEIDARIDDSAVLCATQGRDVVITGMSGWQYRQFFPLLLPTYAEIGVAGAQDQLDQLRREEHLGAALARLTARYADEGLIRGLPVEL